MGVFRQFPYSNFHDMNMDEIIKIVKEMLEEWATYHAQWDTWQQTISDDWSNYQEVMNEAWQDMQDFINTYFDNLDVQNEINNKINAMIQTGEFATIVSPYIPDEVAAWLADHITEPVGVVIDTSLSVSGACADAKATGDAIKKLKTTINGINVWKIYNESNWSVTISIEDVPCKIQTPSVSMRIAREGVTLRDFSTAPYIITNAGTYTISLAAQNTEISIITGKIITKSNIYGDNFTLAYANQGSIWGDSGLARQGAAVTMPVVKKTFNSLTCDYDCSCFILNDNSDTDTTPAVPNLNARNGYNIVTKDMLPADYCVLVVAFSGDFIDTPTLADMPYSINGLNSMLEHKYNLDCTSRDLIGGGSVIIEKNKEKFLNYKMSTVYSKKPSGTVMPQSDEFYGCMYSGGSHSGSFLYHITPAMYRSALCNQFSRAYGLLDAKYFGGVYYGLVCSKTASLFLGAHYPYTTLDYMLNNIMYGPVSEFDINTDLLNCKIGDVLEQISDYTGHCVSIDGVTEIGEIPIINIYEGTLPYTKHSNFPLTNDMGTYLGHAAPYDFYSAAYDLKLDTDYDTVRDISSLSVWDQGYTEPQNVMCDRGYGALYVTPISDDDYNYSNCYLTIADSVSTLTITKNGVPFTVNKNTLTALTDYDESFNNGYHVFDITDILTTNGYGEYEFIADGDTEKIYFKDISDFDMTVTSGDTTTEVTFSAGAPDPMYIVGSYQFTNGRNSKIYIGTNSIPNTVTLPNGDVGTLFDVTAVFFDDTSKCTYWKDGTYYGV